MAGYHAARKWARWAGVGPVVEPADGGGDIRARISARLASVVTESLIRLCQSLDFSTASRSALVRAPAAAATALRNAGYEAAGTGLGYPANALFNASRRGEVIRFKPSGPT